MQSILAALCDELPQLIRDVDARNGVEGELRAAARLAIGDAAVDVDALVARLLDLLDGHPATRRRLLRLLRAENQALAVRPFHGAVGIDDGMIRRHVDVACPDRVALDAPRVTVVVRLRVSEPAVTSARESLRVSDELPVIARIGAPAFECLEGAAREIAIVRGGDSPPAVFDLRPVRAGDARITFDFLQAGTPIGSTSVTVQVVAAGASPVTMSAANPGRPADNSGAAARGGASLELAGAPQPPDLVLVISHDEGENSLRYLLLSTADGRAREFAPVRLRTDPRASAYRYIEHAVAMNNRVDPTANSMLGATVPLPATDIDLRLRQLGHNLWRDLFPSDFRALYGRERERWRGASLMVLSDEPWFPWELVCPYDDGGAWEDDEPWCLGLALTRWLRRDRVGNGIERGAPASLRLGALACVAPRDAGLPTALRERELLGEWAARHEIRDVSPEPATWSRVLALLADGTADWIHFAAHGTFAPGAPDLDAAVWLEGRVALTPAHLIGVEVERALRRNRVAVVMNTCHAGRQGLALSGLGGWAQRLVGRGAGLFVAPMWTVMDRPAGSFAVAFYEALGAGHTVAHAARVARQAARRRGDSSWLAYSVYGHPNARLALRRDTATGREIEQSEPSTTREDNHAASRETQDH